MAGTRTAPTIDGSPGKVIVSIRLIDSSGDKHAESIILDAVPLDADVESYVAAYVAMSQASVYEVNVSSNYVGDADPDNATTDQRNSVKDGVNLLWRDDINNKVQGQRVVAPVTGGMQGNQDIPLLTYAQFVTLIAETGDLLTDYALQSAQYTERKERNNERVKA